MDCLYNSVDIHDGDYDDDNDDDVLFHRELIVIFVVTLSQVSMIDQG